MQVHPGHRIAIDYQAISDNERLSGGSESVILVDPVRFDALWRQSDQYIDNVGKDPSGRADGDRYARFGRFFFDQILRGKPLRLPEVFLVEQAGQHRIRFHNGRHRTAWLRDHGIRLLLLRCSVAEVTAWERLVGAVQHPRGTDFFW